MNHTCAGAKLAIECPRCGTYSHDAVLLAETDEAARAFVRWVHGTDHFVIPVIDGKDYG